MPIPLPNLDDRTFDDLVAEAIALVPSTAPGWTDHNPSDPGIALIELLAWLTEMLLFQVNQIPAAHTEAFLRLLNGSGPLSRPPEPPDDAAATLRRLYEPYRAVTPPDYEYLVRNAARLIEQERDGSRFPLLLDRDGRLGRVRCVPRRDLAGSGGARAGHVSVVVIPPPATDPAAAAHEHPEPSAELLAAVHEFLDERRLLGTQLHVVGPDYLEVGIEAVLALRDDAGPDALDDVVEELRTFLDPFTGGRDGLGWPFGRNVYASEVYAVLEEAELVGQVESVLLAANPSDRRRATTSEVEIELAGHQLVRVSEVQLVGYDVLGRDHRKRWPERP